MNGDGGVFSIFIFGVIYFGAKKYLMKKLMDFGCEYTEERYKWVCYTSFAFSLIVSVLVSVLLFKDSPYNFYN